MTKTVTRAQIVAAVEALGLDPEETGQVTIWPDAVLVQGRPGVEAFLAKVVEE